MFEVTDFKIENFEKPLFDIDITQSNSWIGITGHLENPYPRIDLGNYGSHIHFENKSFELPKHICAPIVRSIDEATALVFGRSIDYDENNKTNAWIINSVGKVQNEFSTVWAIENVVVTKDFIVIGYFDEAACYGEGLEIYDFEGKLQFGYEDFFGKDAVSIDDCYATALVEENKIIFFPYTEFPLVLFDIENKTQQVWETPKEVAGSKAITKCSNHIYFHSPYNDRFGIYKWKIGSKEVQKVGEYENYLTRGLPNGRFFAMNDSGYSIISLK